MHDEDVLPWGVLSPAAFPQVTLTLWWKVLLKLQIDNGIGPDLQLGETSAWS